MKAPWERKLRMVWEVKKDGLTNFLVGTAHFFPCSFRRSLTHIINKADVVLFEGPLDESNMDAVREYGHTLQNGTSLYDALDPKTIAELNKELGGGSEFTECSLASYIHVFSQAHGDLLSRKIGGLRPWMAFFSLWSQYLVRRGWKYSVDLEALSVARELGKKVIFLETIEEQLDALDGIPFERIVSYLNSFDKWGRYSRNHKKHYLRGSLDKLLTITTAFPTRCSSIIENRDPVFHERMMPYIESGGVAVFLGTTHIQGVTNLLNKDGFTVTQVKQ
jgi:hypothetical protein